MPATTREGSRVTCHGFTMIGHDTIGSGKRGVIVLNDWISDTSSWDGARPYLDLSAFTWAFADLRGYGRSKQIEGQFTLTESTADVLELADSLGWARFSIVGHSMSTLVALQLAQHHSDRIERAVVLSPVPPTGLNVPQGVLDMLQAVARGDDRFRFGALKHNSSDRLTEQWLRFKVERWRAGANSEAVAAYALMYARDGLTHPTASITVPLLAITGEEDAETMRSEPVRAMLTPLCPHLVVAALPDCGHYPMQEMPPRLVSVIERFLGRDLESRN